MKGRGLTVRYVADIQVETRCGRVRSAGLDIRGSRLHDVRA